MNCPRCNGSVLDEREREGIVVDVCSRCRGVWLDRGELEKLIARSRSEWDEAYSGPDSDRPARIKGEYSDPRYAGHPGKKRGWLHALGDIFD